MRSNFVDNLCQKEPVQKCRFGSICTPFPYCDLLVRSPLGQHKNLSRLYQSHN